MDDVCVIDFLSILKDFKIDFFYQNVGSFSLAGVRFFARVVYKEINSANSSKRLVWLCVYHWFLSNMGIFKNDILFQNSGVFLHTYFKKTKNVILKM